MTEVPKPIFALETTSHLHNQWLSSAIYFGLGCLTLSVSTSSSYYWWYMLGNTLDVFKTQWVFIHQESKHYYTW